MKKLKRAAALAAVVILLAMYGCTLIFALLDKEWALDFLWASLACTILVPVLLYAMILIYRLLKRSDDSENEESGSSK